MLSSIATTLHLFESFYFHKNALLFVHDCFLNFISPNCLYLDISLGLNSRSFPFWSHFLSHSPNCMYLGCFASLSTSHFYIFVVALLPFHGIHFQFLFLHAISHPSSRSQFSYCLFYHLLQEPSSLEYPFFSAPINFDMPLL